MVRGTVKAHTPKNYFAPVYDLGFSLFALFAGGESLLRGALIESAEPLNGKEVLELFAGTATLSILASEAGANLTALDIDANMLGVAMEKANRAGFDVKFVQADAISLPLRDSAFDSVIISLGLHGLTDTEAGVALKEAYRVLRNGGQLILFDFHAAVGLRGLWQKLFFSLTQRDAVWGWLVSDIQTMIRKSGFVEFNRTYVARDSMQYISAFKQ